MAALANVIALFAAAITAVVAITALLQTVAAILAFIILVIQTIAAIIAVPRFVAIGAITVFAAVLTAAADPGISDKSTAMLTFALLFPRIHGHRQYAIRAMAVIMTVIMSVVKVRYGIIPKHSQHEYQRKHHTHNSFQGFVFHNRPPKFCRAGVITPPPHGGVGVCIGQIKTGGIRIPWRIASSSKMQTINATLFQIIGPPLLKNLELYGIIVIINIEYGGAVSVFVGAATESFVQRKQMHNRAPLSFNAARLIPFFDSLVLLLYRLYWSLSPHFPLHWCGVL